MENERLWILEKRAAWLDRQLARRKCSRSSRAAISAMGIAGVITTIGLGLLFIAPLSFATDNSADDVLARSRAAYGALHSYSDTGEVLSEYQGVGTTVKTSSKDAFNTAFQSPRSFFFKYTKDGGEQYVIWSGDGAQFNSWWSATHVHNEYPSGKGTLAFALGDSPTRGATQIIAPLLFPKAGMHGPLTAISEARLQGDESIDAHTCFKISGQENSGFGGGTRPITVWVDRETLLVRRIFEHTPSSSGGGVIWSLTTTLQPVVNPSLSADKFAFAAPK